MTGPEHYREAERLLSRLDAQDVMDRAKSLGISVESFVAAFAHVVAKAQVHATLALAAAEAEGEHCSNGWSDAIAKRPVTS